MPSPFGTGFVQALTQGAQKQIDQKHDEEEALKKEKRDMYWGIAYDTTGKYSDAQKQAAQQELGKLLGPSAKKGLAKFGDIFGKLSKPQGQPGQPQPSQDSAQAAPAQGGPQSQLPTPKTPAPGGTPSQSLTPSGVDVGLVEQTGKPARGPSPSPQLSQLPTPKTALPTPQAQSSAGGLPPIQTDQQIQARQDTAAKADQARKQDAESAEYETWLKRGKEVLGADASPRDLAEYAGSGGKKLPAVAAVKMTPVQLTMKDGENIPAMRSTDGKYYDLRNNLLDGDAIKAEAGKPSSAMPRFSGQDITLESAKAQAKGGEKFSGIDGSEIDLNALPPNMVLQPLTMGGKVLFLPVDPAQTHITVGNEVIATDKYHMKDVATGGGTALGQARVPTQGTRSEIAYDAQGNPVVNTLPSSSTPVTTGVQGQKTPAAPANSTPKPAAGPTSKTPTPGTPAQAPPQANGTPPAQPPRAVIRGVPAGQYRAMLERVTPVREAATQVFGDPSQPDLKGLKDYISLADDPKSREKLGKALRLTFDGINDASHGGNVAVAAGPVSVSAGGIGQWLENSLHVPQSVAAQKAKIMQDAIKDLSPKEQEAYDSIMSAFSTVVGLRSLTRASAAQGSVAAIERELPIIGVNTQNGGQFADQMQRLAEVVYNGTKGIPPGMFDPAMVERIKGLPAEMQKIKNSRSKLQTPDSKPSAPKPGEVQKGYRFKGGDPADKSNWEPVKAAA